MGTSRETYTVPGDPANESALLTNVRESDSGNREVKKGKYPSIHVMHTEVKSTANNSA